MQYIFLCVRVRFSTSSEGMLSDSDEVEHDYAVLESADAQGIHRPLNNGHAFVFINSSLTCIILIMTPMKIAVPVKVLSPEM